MRWVIKRVASLVAMQRQALSVALSNQATHTLSDHSRLYTRHHSLNSSSQLHGDPSFRSPTETLLSLAVAATDPPSHAAPPSRFPHTPLCSLSPQQSGSSLSSSFQYYFSPC
ncbi:hypothetical protein Hanom_Chr11g00992621 [Helianthus anomalus]